MNAIPFLDRLAAAKRILIAGCGGGFDVFAGVPIAQRLLAAGSEVVFANFSFTNLWLCGGERISPVLWRIDQQSSELPYFPERWMVEWLVARGQPAPFYAFAKSGVRPLSAAFRSIVERHGIDLVVLVDGGTDSIQFGDEPDLGSVVEDAVSTVAACASAGERVVVAAIGFGVDHYHGVSHYAFLENVARLIRERAFLGSFSIVSGAPDADAFLDLVDYANERQPQHRSIVCNSIAGALRGDFGNHHATNRTSGSEMFINPLMAQYWTFDAQRLVAQMAYAADLADTERLEDARRIIEHAREGLELRPRQPLPL